MYRCIDCPSSFVLNYYNNNIKYVLFMYYYTCLHVVLGKRVAAVGLVDYLGHSDHVVVVVADRHAQYQIGRVTSHVINFPVEPRVLYKHE